MSKVITEIPVLLRELMSVFLGAGLGTRPTTDTGNDLIDAIVWVKPPGESDGTSDTTSARYDTRKSINYIICVVL